MKMRPWKLLEVSLDKQNHLSSQGTFVMRKPSWLSSTGNYKKNRGATYGKPLLTDEIIERANRGDDIFGPPLQDDEETKILSFSSQNNRYSRSRDHGFSQDTLTIEVEPSIHKSRRIETRREMSLILN